MISAPGFLQGFDDSVGKSVSKSVFKIGLPVPGWMGFPLTGSREEVCRAGYSVPGLPSSYGVPMWAILGCGVLSDLNAGAGVDDALRTVDSICVGFGLFCLCLISVYCLD